MAALARTGGRVLGACRHAAAGPRNLLTAPIVGASAGWLPSVPAVRTCAWRGQLRCATTVFNVKPKPGQAGAEQTLFVVGLNEGKFFGQDGAEEGLKLLERIADHGPHGTQYNVLFGLSQRDLTTLEGDHKVKHNRLTPSRDLETRNFGEFVPIIQASMVDGRPRKAIGRLLKTTQGAVAWQLWKHPREAIKVYWTYYKRKQYKDAALRKFWMDRLPTCAYPYFKGVAHLIAYRATSLMVASYGQEKANTWVLVVSNQFFEPTVERLGLLLDPSTVTKKFTSEEFPRHLKEQADHLLYEFPDFTPLLIFGYVLMPVLGLQTLWLATQYLISLIGVEDMLMPPEYRE